MPESADSTPRFALDDVKAGYATKHPIIRGATLEVVGPGVTRLRGCNGSGKSALVELLSGYLRPQSGAVSVCGIPAGSAAARSVRSVCRTQVSVFPQMTVHDHLALAARSREVSLDDARARAHSYGLGRWLDAPAGTMSTGNLRKLWTVICTVRPSPVIILDEPFIGMDDHGCARLNDEIVTWSETSLVLLIAHAGGEPWDACRTLDMDEIGCAR